MEVWRWVEEQPLEKQQRWYVNCDGCHTHSPDGWHETKFANLQICKFANFYPQQGENSEAHAIEESVRYVATRDTAETFGQKWFQLAQHSGVYREGEENAEIVAIGDGSEWIWNLVDEHFPNAVQIIDYPHAVGHLWNCALDTKGFQNQDPVIQWVKTTETSLFQGEIPQVVKQIVNLAQAHPTLEQDLGKLAAYFEKQAIHCSIAPSERF